MVDKSLISERQNKVRGELAKRNINALIITKPANVSYLTNFRGDDSWLLLTFRRVFLLTDSRYTEQAKKECFGCKIIERKESLAKTAAALIRENQALKAIGIEDSASLAVFADVKKNVKLKIKKTSSIVENNRIIKDKTEIAAIASAARIAQKALNQTLRAIRIGITESQTAGLLNLNIRRFGWRESFETIVAFGPNTSRPHHLCTSRKLRRNDIILIDWGVRCENYCCDLTRCFAFGKSSPFFVNAYNAVLEAQRLAIAKVKAGVKASDVDAAARQTLIKHKLPVYGHGAGHGVGIEVHEAPFVTANIHKPLEAGQVITIEPGVYIPGKLGIRIEDDILVTKTGCRILSAQADRLRIIK